MNGKGGCLCGAVRFDVGEIEPHFHACHCTMCQKWCGGPAFATQMVTEFALEGEAALKRFPSSEWAERGFCAECGSSLFYHLKGQGTYAFWVGAFDDPTQFSIDGEIFVDDPRPCFEFQGDHSRQTGAEMMAAFSGDAE